MVEAYKDIVPPLDSPQLQFETFRHCRRSYSPVGVVSNIQYLATWPSACWIQASFVMASFVLYLSATVLFVQSTVASNCTKKPIYVDIHKRAVHDSSVFQYGSFIGLGTPAQNQSLWPSLQQNHVSFASNNYCKDTNTTLKDCDTHTGGFFNDRDSDRYACLEIWKLTLWADM